jgi:hypothetical protein
VHVDVATGEPTPAFALAALLDFPVKVRHVDARPATIEVRDAGVRDHLADALDGTGTLVRPVDRLPAAEEGVANFEAASAARPRVPGLLEATGMTVARVRPFADAAAAFYAARLWRHLVNEDLIVVDAPGGGVPADLSVGSLRRPDPAELTWMERLLRGLADVTEGELDAGAWERRSRNP